MKKFYIVLAVSILTHGIISPINDTNTTSNSTNHSPKKQKKSNFSLSTLSGISAFAYYAANIKIIGGSTIFIIFGILKHIWNSKASVSSQQQTQEQVDNIQNEVDSLKTNFNSGLTEVKEDLKNLVEIMGKLTTGHEEIKGSTEHIKTETNKLYVLSSATDVKVDDVQKLAKQTNDNLEIISKQIGNQQTGLDSANTYLENLSKKIISLEEQNNKHVDKIDRFAEVIEKNMETTKEYNNTVNLVNAKSEKIERNMEIILKNVNDTNGNIQFLLNKINNPEQNS